MKKSIVLLLIALLTSGIVFAQDESNQDLDSRMGFWESCETPQNLPDTLTVGAIFSLSGDLAVYGTSQRQAVELALAEINEVQYFGEERILEIAFEDAVSAEGAVAAMTSLAEDEEILAIIGPTLSTHAFAADPIAQENGLVVLGVSNTANGITDMGDFVFRDSLPESSVIPGTVAGTAAALGIETVAILYGSDDDFTLSGYNVFLEALTANELEILGEESFLRGDVDFSVQLINLLSLEPDALILSALASEATQIISQARNFGYTGPIIGGNGLNSPTVIMNAGDASEGVIVGAAWNIASPNPLSVEFASNYELNYGAKPDQFSAQAYTGAWLIATAIRCADSTDRLAIRDALAEIQDFPSPLGLFSFDEDRNPVHEPVVQIVQDGAFTVLGAEAADE